MGFVHDEDYSSPTFGIADIDACDDVTTLRDWLTGSLERQGDIEAQVEAALKCEHYDDDWMERTRGALGFTGMGIRRLRRRLLELGYDAVANTPRSEVHALRVGIEKAKENTAKAQQKAAFGRHLLSAMTAALPRAAVEAICAEAARLATAEDRAENALPNAA